jgi:exosortase N
MLSLEIKYSNPVIAGYLLSVIYLAIIVVALNSYFLWSANLLIGLIFAPYICAVEKGKFSFRYFAPALVLIVLAIFIPVRTTIFLALLFTCLFFLENFFGKISAMLLFLLVLISPIFQYISNLIGFPVRLWLSDIASSVLGMLGTDTYANGNMIMQGNNEFSVDQACAGLNMLATSLIISLFAMAHFQKRLNRRLSILNILFLLSLTICLNIACNLIRIVLLVQFRISPESIYHDIIGMLCLLIYVIGPLLFLVKIAVRKYGKCFSADNRHDSFSAVLRYPWLHVSLLAIILFASFRLTSMDRIAPSINAIEVPGYKKQALSSGVLKFESEDGLIYLKFGAFYAPEHNPMVCWEGSGYTFRFIKKERCGSTEIYTGILEKGKDKIYSAWWFDNGKIRTIDQFNWRWRAARGEGNFYLVNANAKDAVTLKRITASLLSGNLNYGTSHLKN